MSVTYEIKDIAGSDTQSHTSNKDEPNRQAQFVGVFAPASNTTSGTTFSFGGTLESAQTFAIMESDSTTSTYGKQGYSYGFRAIGMGL